MAQTSPRLIYLLTTAQHRVETAVGRESGGLSAARIGLLLALPPQGSLAMIALARALDLGAPAISGLVDRMEKSGLVRRLPDTADKRSFLVSLTDQGRTLRQQAAARAGVINDTLREGFTDEEINVVARWLEAVRQKCE